MLTYVIHRMKLKTDNHCSTQYMQDYERQVQRGLTLQHSIQISAEEISYKQFDLVPLAHANQVLIQCYNSIKIKLLQHTHNRQ